MYLCKSQSGYVGCLVLSLSLGTPPTLPPRIPVSGSTYTDNYAVTTTVSFKCSFI